MATALQRAITELGEDLLTLDLDGDVIPRVKAFKSIHGIKRQEEITGQGYRQGENFRYSDPNRKVEYADDIKGKRLITFCNKVYDRTAEPNAYLYSQTTNSGASSLLKLPDDFHPITCLNCLKIIRGLRAEQERLRADAAPPIHILNRKPQTIFAVNYDDVENTIRAEFNAPNYELIASQEYSNDQSDEFTVDGKLDEYEEQDVSDLIASEGVKANYRLGAFLNKLCQRGTIQPGKYVMRISW